MTEGLEQLRKDFNWFRSECIKLRNTYNTYHVLFESGDEVSELLRTAAGSFFEDLSGGLVELIYLQVGRLTDPARTSGCENLTLHRIIAGLKEKSLLSDRISDLAQSIQGYRDKIKPARNKAIAHLDVSSIYSGAVLSAHNQSDVVEFFENLQEFTDEVGRALGVGPLDYRATPVQGDVHDLIRLLKRCQGREITQANHD